MYQEKASLSRRYGSLLVPIAIPPRHGSIVMTASCLPTMMEVESRRDEAVDEAATVDEVKTVDAARTPGPAAGGDRPVRVRRTFDLKGVGDTRIVAVRRRVKP
jgi:hypothetical protein